MFFPHVRSFIDEQVKNLAQMICSYRGLSPTEAREVSCQDPMNEGDEIGIRNTKFIRKGAKYRTYSMQFKRKIVADIEKEINKKELSLTKVIKTKSK